MSAKMEYKGKDVEEAISEACAALKTTRENLEIQIVSTGATGIFGLGRKKAVVQVSLKTREKSTRSEGRKPEARNKPEGRKKEGLSKLETAPVAVRPPRAEQPAGEELLGDPVSAEDVEAIRQDLTTLLDHMGCPSPVEIEVDSSNKVHARIRGEFIEVITGVEGQTLDAIQYLMRKIITKKFPQKVLFALDAGDFRMNRQEELKERAIRLAEEVKESGKTLTIAAIGPAERRIVHLALQDDTGIRSRSVGDGQFKKVLIYLPGKGRKRSGRKPKSTETAESTGD